MKLPNGDQAVIDTRKIHDYCLNPDHELGRQKARLFSDILGIGQSNASRLEEALAIAALTGEVSIGRSDAYGTRYLVDFVMQHGARSATVRSSRIILSGDSIPRLVTCYIL